MKPTQWICHLLFAALLLCSATLFADTGSVGTLTSVSGRVSLVHAGTTVTAVKGAALATGDEIDTGTDGHAEFQLADGSVFSLFSNSRFVVKQYDYDENAQRPGLGLFDLFAGGMRAITGAISRFEHRVEINTPVGTIGIRGTEFTSEIGNDALDVSMLEGTGVFLRNPQGDQVELNQPGHATHMAFQRMADGQFHVERPGPVRMMRVEEMAGLRQRMNWMDGGAAERVHRMRDHFREMDRTRKPGEAPARGPRFNGRPDNRGRPDDRPGLKGRRAGESPTGNREKDYAGWPREQGKSLTEQREHAMEQRRQNMERREQKRKEHPQQAQHQSKKGQHARR